MFDNRSTNPKLFPRFFQNTRRNALRLRNTAMPYDMSWPSRRSRQLLWPFFYVLAFYHKVLSLHNIPIIQRLYRPTAILCLLIAVMLAVAAYTKGLTTSEIKHPYRQLIIASIIVAIHLGYWALLTRDSIFLKRPERIGIHAIAFPMFLLVGYGVNYFNTDPKESAPVYAAICFAVTYSLWFLYELIALGIPEDHDRLPSDMGRAAVWLFIEGFLAIGLTITIFEYYCSTSTKSDPLLSQHILFGMFGVKDVVIVINLGGYLLSWLLVRWFSQWNQDLYRAICIRRMTLDRIIPHGNFNQLVETACDDKHGVLRILDYDAGAALGTTQLLKKWLPIIKKRSLAIDLIGYLEKRAFIDSFNDSCKKLQGAATACGVAMKYDSCTKLYDNSSDEIRPTDVKLENFDVIVFSHVLQKKSDAAEIRRRIYSSGMSLKPGAWLFIIGRDESHCVASRISDASARGVYPHEYSRWQELYLAWIMNRSRFDDIAASVKPLFYIERRVPITPELARYYPWWLDSILGSQSANSERESLSRKLTEIQPGRQQFIHIREKVFVLQNVNGTILSWNEMCELSTTGAPVSGSQWYEYFAAKYGSQKVTWVGSAVRERNVPWAVTTIVKRIVSSLIRVPPHPHSTKKNKPASDLRKRFSTR